ncbi:unnamed protein product [Trichobilharzia szidati]|nr:unnamed protein product [Trichobilharzia szidati]
MTFSVSITFLLLICLLSCFASRGSGLSYQDFRNIQIRLEEYTVALLEVKAKQLEVYEMRAVNNETNVLEKLLNESHRLDRLYALKWINELMSSPVFQANEVIDKDTKIQYANEYEVKKLLNKSTPLDTGSEALLQKIKEKWEARARLYAAENAYLSRSSTKCLKKEDNTPVKENLVIGEKRIRELKKAAKMRLFEAAETYKKFTLNLNDTQFDSLRNNFLWTPPIFIASIDALFEKTEEVENQRLHYLLCFRSWSNNTPEMSHHYNNN